MGIRVNQLEGSNLIFFGCTIYFLFIFKIVSARLVTWQHNSLQIDKEI